MQPFQKKKEHSEVLTLNLIDFYLNVAEGAAAAARIKITSADISKDTKITIKHILKHSKSADDKTSLTYEWHVTIKNNRQRNVALELLEMFRKLGLAHLKYISYKFESYLDRYAGKISNFIMQTQEKGLFASFDQLLQNTA